MALIDYRSQDREGGREGRIRVYTALWINYTCSPYLSHVALAELCSYEGLA